MMYLGGVVDTNFGNIYSYTEIWGAVDEFILEHLNLYVGASTGTPLLSR